MTPFRFRIDPSIKRQRIHSPQSLFNEDTVLSILFLHLRDHFLNNKVGKKKERKNKNKKKQIPHNLEVLGGSKNIKNPVNSHTMTKLA